MADSIARFNPQQHLLLIRGLPGSGKSTIAKMICDNRFFWHHVEADMFMLSTTGEYEYSPQRLAMAHERCKQKAFELLSDGVSVVVSNTFTRKWEMEPYIAMVQHFPHIAVSIMTANGNFQNIHGVPAEKIEAMRQRWEY